MPDVYLVSGNATAADITLTDPTVLVGGVTITGTGDITSAAASLEAQGLETFTATAAITLADSALAGTAAQMFSATGSETVGVSTLASTAVLVGLGTGALAQPATLIEGAAAQAFLATGALAPPASALAVVGGAIFAASGAVALPVAALTSDALSRFVGTSAVLFGVADLAGTAVAGTDIVGLVAVASSVALDGIAVSVPPVSLEAPGGGHCGVIAWPSYRQQYEWTEEPVWRARGRTLKDLTPRTIAPLWSPPAPLPIPAITGAGAMTIPCETSGSAVLRFTGSSTTAIAAPTIKGIAAWTDDEETLALLKAAA